ncbi:hypothetical protein SAMN04487972_10913 [Paracoccus halophilus]|uniref:Uncharacterized protein n=2 Tax=Paracoccus halophilus TaxID=376733 RepID=A0A099F222_9RHOB|nr:hypothetical protein IT41_10980 [Paracoccus halophilus]SFA51881.1 hypothetical protein SAMN04487972_10913 [Paracoccus halophilus]
MNGVSILAWGLATAADGDSLAQAAMLVEGRPHFHRHPRWVGRDGQRQIMCWASGLRDHVDFASRVALLVQRAWAACRDAQIARGMQPARAELILALPLLLGIYPGMRERFTAAAARLKFDGMSAVQMIFGEHAVGLAALERAAHTFARDKERHIYVAAADTLVAPMVLDMLAARGELRDRNSPWNAVPSEAAVCMLVAPSNGADDGCPRLVGCASGIEDIQPDAPEGGAQPGENVLAEAARESIAQAPGFVRIISDASGGRWRAEELGRVISALGPDAAELPVLTTAQAVGDVGAASALLSVVAGISAGPGASLILASERSGSRRTAMALPASADRCPMPPCAKPGAEDPVSA